MLKALNLFLLVILVLAVFPSLASAKGNGALEGRLATLLPKDARWALSVVDMETGTVMTKAGNTDNVLTPGSLVKLFTSGAAFDYAKDNDEIDMTTTIKYNGTISNNILKGDLYIIGRGNALLSIVDLKDALKGLKAVEGDVVVDDSLFNTRGFKRTRRGPAYARPSALGMDLHTAAVVVTPTSHGEAPSVRIEPMNDNVRFAISARAIEGGINTLEIIKIDDNAYKVTGNIPVSVSMTTATIKKRFAIDDPAIYTGHVIKTILGVGGNVRRAKAGAGLKELAKVEAPELKDLIKDMNVNSLNVVADNLLFSIGEGSSKKGIEAVKDLFKELGLSTVDANVNIADGSGLSKGNKVSADLTARYLYEVSKRPWFDDFKESLPKAGEGTSEGMDFKDKRFSIKTGVLEDAFALGGYGTDNRGRDIAFSYIVNVPGAGLAGAERAGAAVMEHIAGGVLK